MTLRNRLIIVTLIPLVLSVSMIGFIIYQTLHIQSSAKDDVDLLLKVKDLEQSLVVTSQSLANYTYNSSDANKDEALTMMTEVQKNLAALSSVASVPGHKKLSAALKENMQSCRMYPPKPLKKETKRKSSARV